jgi:hypothetical protein
MSSYNVLTKMHIEFSLLLALASFGCSHESPIQSASPPLSKRATVDKSRPLDEEFGVSNVPGLSESGVSNVPPGLSDSEKMQLIDNVKTLKKGDNLADVVKLLGTPDYAHKIEPKKRGQITDGSSLVQYRLKKTFGPPNMNDPEISLEFDRNDQLKKISTNIANLTNGELINGR